MGERHQANISFCVYFADRISDRLTLRDIKQMIQLIPHVLRSSSLSFDTIWEGDAMSPCQVGL